MRGNTTTIKLVRGVMNRAFNPLYQYDYGQKLTFEETTLPVAYEVHFSNCEYGDSKVCIGDSEGVAIPDEYLLSGEPVYVWVFLHDGENDGETEYRGMIPVIQRSKSTDIPVTPVEQDVITQTIAALNHAVDLSNTNVEHYPRIIDDIWYVWDANEGDFVSTGYSAKGDIGPYYTPSVNPDGTISWTNNGGLPNPAPVNIVEDLDFAKKEDIPTKVSDLIDDSGHYTKPVTGIPETDLDQSLILSITSKIDASEKGSAYGVAMLDDTGRVPSSQLPSYVDDVIEYPSSADFPYPGESGKLYVDMTTNEVYRWSGTVYISVSEAGADHAPKANPVFTGSISLGRKANTVVGGRSSAIGLEVTASGANSHGEGNNTTASGTSAHAEGSATKATADYAHAEGTGTTASSMGSHSEGNNTTANGYYSHAEGQQTTASGEASHAEGYLTTASGIRAHAEGSATKASGSYSHAEGLATEATSYGSHAEGNTSKAREHFAHAEGSGSIADGEASHAEGGSSQATGNFSHAEGGTTVASGMYTHAEGYQSTASAYAAHSEGASTTASGGYAHAEGGGTTASGLGAHTEGGGTIATGTGAHAEGNATGANGHYSHAEGDSTHTYGNASHTEGYYTETHEIARGAHAEGDHTHANAMSSHAEGAYTVASSDSAHAEGNATTASGSHAHAEGAETTASGINSHAEGVSTNASGNGSHAEGSGTTASGSASHAEGAGTTAANANDHAEGAGTIARGVNSHAEGAATTASGGQSHAEGAATMAIGPQSHAEGTGTKAVGFSSHAAGAYNIADSYDNWPEWTADTQYEVGDKVKRTTMSGNDTVVRGYICKTANSDSSFTSGHWNDDYGRMNFIEIIGNGSDDTHRSNVRAMDWDGNAYFMGDVYVGCNPDSTGGTKLTPGGGSYDVATIAETQAIIDEYEVSA